MARKPRTAAPKVDTPTAVPLALPAELTIYTVGELHPQWLQWLHEVTARPEAANPAPVQAAAVDQIDAAGLQLLLALNRSLAERGSALSLQAPSAVLRGGCEALGLGSWLQAHEAGSVLSGAAA